LLPQNIQIKTDRAIILPLVYIGMKRGLLLREEHRLRLFEKKVLRKVFRPKRKWVTDDWRKLHSEERSALLTKHYPVIKSIRMRWAGYVARIGE